MSSSHLRSTPWIEIGLIATGLAALIALLDACAAGPAADASVARRGPVTFLQIGDPQIGRLCDSPEFNPSGDADACEEIQTQNLIETLEYARSRGADFVWLMGDQTERRTPSQKRRMREALARFPDLDVRHVIGNHDIASSTCSHLGRYVRNAFEDEPPIARPQWEAFEVRGHHFIGLNTNLWGGHQWGPCEALDDVCDGGAKPGTACNSDLDCGGDGVCTNWEEAAQAQKRFVVEAFDAALADPDLVRVWLGGHHTAWANSFLGPNDHYTVHDVERCAGGAHAGRFCSALPSQGVTAASCAAAGGTCEPDPPRRYRTLLRQQMLRPACVGRCNYFLSGHQHSNTTWRPEGIFEFHVSAGTAAMGNSVDPEHPLGALVWTAHADGRVEREVFSVSRQPPF